LRRIDLPAKLADAAFGLAEGGISEPVRSPLGWHILRVVKIQQGSTPSFEDMRKKIHKQVARDMAADALVGLANKLEDALAGGAGIEAAGAEVNARILRVTGVDRAGLDTSGKLLKNIPQDRNFLQVAFETPMGEASTLSETADGGFFLVRVDGVIPPTLKPLDMVRNQAVKAWKERRRYKAARQTADEIRKRAGRSSLAAAAKRHGLTTQSSPLVTRDSVDEKAMLSRAAITALFSLKPGARAVAATGRGYAVVELKKIRKADPAAAPKRLKELNALVKGAFKMELDAYFTANLRQRFTVTINRPALDALF
jgi:peptidyl-prolyl cis-trans isomerase D